VTYMFRTGRLPELRIVRLTAVDAREMQKFQAGSQPGRKEPERRFAYVGRVCRERGQRAICPRHNFREGWNDI